MKLSDYKITIQRACMIVTCCLLLAVDLGLILVQIHGGKQEESPMYNKTVEVVYDTIAIYNPIPKDSTIVRYITSKLPVKDDGAGGIPMPDGGENKNDSTTVEIPIIQKVYGDSTYRAWVSGFMAELDSIEVYQRKEYIRETVTVTKTKKWNFTIGPTVGAGWNGRKIDPYVGLGVTWGWSF